MLRSQLGSLNKKSTQLTIHLMPSQLCIYNEFIDMNNKANELPQNKVISLRIANIKFSVLHKNHRKKSSTTNVESTPKRQQTEEIVGMKERVHNCFIPSTSIKSQAQIQRMRKINNVPLFPVDATYSKFPVRRPKSIKPHSYFPVYRERIVSCCDKRALTSSQISQFSQKVQRRLKMRLRTTTKSCLTLNHPQKESQSFVRYSNLNIQTEFNANTQRQKSENRVTIEKYYL